MIDKDTLMNLIDEYAEVRHINGCWVYNSKTASARQAVIEALSGVQALSAAPARWVERWHGSGGKEFWEGWSILNAANREMIAHLGPDVGPDAVRYIVAAHNASLCGECAGTGGRWCPACAGATPPAEQQAAPKAAPARRTGTIAHIGNGRTTLTAAIASVLAAPQREAIGLVESAVTGAGGFHVRLASGAQMPAPGTKLYTAPQPSPAAQAAESVPAVEREQERIAFKDAHRHLELYEVPDAWGRPMFKHSHVEASWLGWIARASHGQAPAAPKGDIDE